MNDHFVTVVLRVPVHDEMGHTQDPIVPGEALLIQYGPVGEPFRSEVEVTVHAVGSLPDGE